MRFCVPSKFQTSSVDTFRALTRHLQIYRYPPIRRTLRAVDIERSKLDFPYAFYDASCLFIAGDTDFFLVVPRVERINVI